MPFFGSPPRSLQPHETGKLDPEVRAAIDLWTPLAAAAWERYLAHGPGVLLIGRDELLAAHARRGEDGDEDGPRVVLPGFVPLSMIPRGDDFRPLLATYDPTRQVMLLVRDPDGAERMVTLEADGVTRPTPEACYRARE